MSGRPSARIFSVAALTAAILSIAGCYGQTDLATHIAQDAATLNARGTANNGPADVYYEYWKTSAPQTKLQTATKTIRGGASGPFDQRVTGLDDQTAYSFRLCGSDQSGSGPAVCAQTRSFFTGLSSVQAFGDTHNPPATRDYERIHVNVVAAPPGGEPSGRVFFGWYIHESTTAYPGGIFFDAGSETEDNVTCVNVQGNVAAVGFRQIPPWPDIAPFSDQQIVYVVDGGPAGAAGDRFYGSLDFDDRDPSDCTIPANIDSIGQAITHGETAVSEVAATSPD